MNQLDIALRGLTGQFNLYTYIIILRLTGQFNLYTAIKFNKRSRNISFAPLVKMK